MSADVGLSAATASALSNTSSSSSLSQQQLQQDEPQTISRSPHILLGVTSGEGYTVTPMTQDSMDDPDENNCSGLVNDLDNEEQAGNEPIVRKFSCPTCHKTFDRQYRLQRHLQIHNPNRPKVNCPMCDKYFTRMDTLENHIKCLHSEERPFKCDFSGCNKSFPLQSSLIHHHKVTLYLMSHLS